MNWLRPVGLVVHAVSSAKSTGANAATRGTREAVARKALMNP
ncbi:hypothetical protein [Congregibacter sp.]